MTVKDYSPKGFLKYAQGYWAAANFVRTCAPDVPLLAYFLVGRSIELSLKAFLLHSGMDIDELKKKKSGHDLAALLSEACKKGLENYITLNGLESGVIQLLSLDYSTKRLEYPESGGTYYLSLQDETWEIARKLAYDLESVGTSSRIPNGVQKALTADIGGSHGRF